MKKQLVVLCAILSVLIIHASAQKDNSDMQSEVESHAAFKHKARQSAYGGSGVLQSDAIVQVAEGESILPIQSQRKPNMPARILQNSAAAWTIKCDSIVDKSSFGVRTEKTEFAYDHNGNNVL